MSFFPFICRTRYHDGGCLQFKTKQSQYVGELHYMSRSPESRQIVQCDKTRPTNTLRSSNKQFQASGSSKQRCSLACSRNCRCRRTAFSLAPVMLCIFYEQKPHMQTTVSPRAERIECYRSRCRAKYSTVNTPKLFSVY